MLGAGYIDPSSHVAHIHESSCVNATFDMTDMFVNVTCVRAVLLGVGYFDPSSHVTQIKGSSCVNATFDMFDVLVNITVTLLICLTHASRVAKRGSPKWHIHLVSIRMIESCHTCERVMSTYE